MQDDIINNYINCYIDIKKFLPIIFLISILFLIISISLSIPGDEPDFYIRINELKNNYQFFDFSNNFQMIDSILEFCQLRRMDPFQNFSICASHSIQLLFLKFIIGFICYSILFAIINFGFMSHDKLMQNILFSVLILLNLPGYPYYLTLFSPEIFYNLLSLISSLVLVSKFKIILLPMLLLLFQIDFGNSLIFSFFILNYIIVAIYINKFKFKFKFLFLFTIIVSLVCILFRAEILETISYFLGSDYFNAISTKILTGLETNNYPILVRYITFLWSSFDLRPSGMNSAPIFAIIFLAWIWAGMHFLANSKLYKAEMIFFSASFITVLLVISLLPTYSFGKYYVFIMPFVMLPIVCFYRSLTVLLSCFFLNTSHLLILAFSQTELFYILFQ